MKHILTAATCFALSTAMAPAATQNMSFTGNLKDDADIGLFEFTIAAPTALTLISYSYAGGVMADGTVVDAGGFDPVLSLWDSNGELVQEWDDGPNAVPADPATGDQRDVSVSLKAGYLAVGTYTAAVAQASNYIVDPFWLDDAFDKSDPFFTASNGCSNGQFCDVSGSNRTSFWAFDFLATRATPSPTALVTAPLPAGFPLLAVGLLAFGLMARRRKTS